MDLLSKRVRRRLHVSYRGFGIRAGWVCEDADERRFGRQLAQQTEPLRIKVSSNVGYACRVAARVSKAGDEAELHRIGGAVEADRDRCGRCLLCDTPTRAGPAHNAHLPAYLIRPHPPPPL